ncbi:transcription initiation factor TFIID subunit 11-like [Temnothorax americanus]|uniref:transcription initiation factor TFIID subunit 11-like n=1 Tax=Temnothorax americanus TaxID=1964332 RepID=UPI0040678AE3
MQVLVSNFTEDHVDRYEMYRRSAFPKVAIKRIMQTTTGCSVSQNVVIAMSGIATLEMLWRPRMKLVHYNQST